MSETTLELPLAPSPGRTWEIEWDALMQDPWLHRKLDRGMRVQEHIEYVGKNCPELQTMEPGIVIDIGPGCGELLEIAEQWGHEGIGIDAATGEGGMGNDYLDACKLMTARQYLSVYYMGLLDFVAKPPVDLVGKVALCNSRGSFEQALSDYMDGTPHSVHQCCRRLRWKETDETAILFAMLFGAFARWLRPDGILLIHANGSADDRWYDQTVREAAWAAGLKLVHIEGQRLHKWIRHC